MEENAQSQMGPRDRWGGVSMLSVLIFSIWILIFWIPVKLHVEGMVIEDVLFPKLPTAS